MNEIKEREVTCCADTSDASSYDEICCCYVELDDGSYENSCGQPVDECCCC